MIPKDKEVIPETMEARNHETKNSIKTWHSTKLPVY